MKIALLFLFLLLMPVVLAEIDFDQELTDEEEEQFDAILAPVMKIYSFIRYAATVIGVLMLVFAGITFVTAGGEMAKKEKAKNIATGVIIGLIVIWVAPLIVKYVFG
ncbi:hypothetical protein HN592_03415 [Candidatus Woesearchaeota archaeon]|jgi:hypothetical protein|nr:hypothetical protein [Candidatus Woesearchaeota archaeon]MBT4368261.1 hypothetical protein [Candidatus Woesearchaeota archaeon]MBT4712750.1 hypothetical protein [Candidatus Woesearchaeota archaeon]MBT6639662.1 hypothetical protein [Candidatus Woesearchaeota archaeon]MBT7133834.1 hypothetical protein [Candidatus Woesearchaeota archaeon]